MQQIRHELLLFWNIIAVILMIINKLIGAILTPILYILFVFFEHISGTILAILGIFETIVIIVLIVSLFKGDHSGTSSALLMIILFGVIPTLLAYFGSELISRILEIVKKITFHVPITFFCMDTETGERKYNIVDDFDCKRPIVRTSNNTSR